MKTGRLLWILVLAWPLAQAHQGHDHQHWSSPWWHLLSSLAVILVLLLCRRLWQKLKRAAGEHSRHSTTP